MILVHDAAMGNEKANSYWEAELPPNYDRVGIENFIRAKYVPLGHFCQLVLIVLDKIAVYYCSLVSYLVPVLKVHIYSLINAYFSRYEDKRWIPKDGKPRSTSQGREEKASAHWHRPGDRGGSGNTSNSENSFEEKKNVQAPSIKDNGPATRISLPVPPKGPEPVCEVVLTCIWSPLYLLFLLFCFQENVSKCCCLLHLLLGL